MRPLAAYLLYRASYVARGVGAHGVAMTLLDWSRAACPWEYGQWGRR